MFLVNRATDLVEVLFAETMRRALRGCPDRVEPIGELLVLLQELVEGDLGVLARWSGLIGLALCRLNRRKNINCMVNFS